jgi:hypothetical protein
MHHGQVCITRCLGKGWAYTKQRASMHVQAPLPGRLVSGTPHPPAALDFDGAHLHLPIHLRRCCLHGADLQRRQAPGGCSSDQLSSA